VERSSFTRWAAPVAFLAAITIGALLVRAGFEQAGHRHTNPPATTATSKTKKHRRGHSHPPVHAYTVQSGDTLAGIAAKTGTSVTRLEQLNPGIDPTALRVGQKIRVQ
jgi:LysM repeat protein